MATNPELESNLVENQTPDQTATVPNVTVEVNINELNTILAALQELPHRVVDPILRKLLQQAQDQLQQG